MNLNALLSNAVFLALTFLPALYLNEFIQSQSTIIQISYCLCFMAAVIGLDYAFGKHLLRISPKHPLVSVYLPLWIFFSFGFNSEDKLIFRMTQFYVVNHCALFVILRMIVDWSNPHSQTPKQMLDYVWIVMLSIPFSSISLVWHFSNSPVQIYTISLIGNSVIYYLASCVGCVLAASATIHRASLLGIVPSNHTQQIKEEFERNQSISDNERKQIEEHLDKKQ